MPHRFSEAELETARNTDLPDLLTSLGYRVKPVGCSRTCASGASPARSSRAFSQWGCCMRTLSTTPEK